MSLLSSSIKGQPEEGRIFQPPEHKPGSQKANQSKPMDHSLVELTEAMSHAMQGHPRWVGHGGDF